MCPNRTELWVPCVCVCVLWGPSGGSGELPSLCSVWHCGKFKNHSPHLLHEHTHTSHIASLLTQSPPNRATLRSAHSAVSPCERSFHIHTCMQPLSAHVRRTYTHTHSPTHTHTSAHHHNYKRTGLVPAEWCVAGHLPGHMICVSSAKCDARARARVRKHHMCVC